VLLCALGRIRRLVDDLKRHPGFAFAFGKIKVLPKAKSKFCLRQIKARMMPGTLIRALLGRHGFAMMRASPARHPSFARTSWWFCRHDQILKLTLKVHGRMLIFFHKTVKHFMLQHYYFFIIKN
jgi:hypothetical protein